jgi:hypothetical protein
MKAVLVKSGRKYILAVLLFHINGFYHFNRDLIIGSACQQKCLNASLGFPQALS